MKYTLTIEAENASELAQLLSGSIAPARQATKESIAAPTAPVAVATTTEEIPAKAKITAEQIREITSEKVQNGKKAQVKKILEKFGAANAASLAEEHRAEYYSELQNL